MKRPDMAAALLRAVLARCAMRLRNAGDVDRGYHSSPVLSTME
jgi:hypothetical protein